jgi:hypothetical protein
MATTASLPQALLPVTPMVGPPVARLMPTTTRAAIGPNATRRARAGANAWSTSANDLQGDTTQCGTGLTLASPRACWGRSF